jgi:hypothetical protein
MGLLFVTGALASGLLSCGRLAHIGTLNRVICGAIFPFLTSRLLM